MSTSLRPSDLAVSAPARLGPHVILDENGKKNGGSVQDPGLLSMKSIRCSTENAGEEAMDFLSFRQDCDILV